MLRDQEGNTIEVKGTPMASNNHRLILGKSGYGKTWCCYRMIEEAVEQKKKCVIFDYSGSYTMKEQERSKFACKNQTYEPSLGLHTGMQARIFILLLKRH